MPQIVPFVWETQIFWGYGLILLLTYVSGVKTLPAILRLMTTRRALITG